MPRCSAVRSALRSIVVAAIASVVLAPVVLSRPQAQSADAAQQPARPAAELPEPVVQSMHATQISALAVSPQAGLLASGSVDGVLKLWSVDTGELLRTVVVARSWIRTLAFSGDGRRLAAGTGEYDAFIYDPMSGRLLETVERAGSAVTAIALSADGSTVVTGTARDGVVRVWQLDAGRRRTDIPVKAPVRAVAFAAGNEVMVLADRASRWRLGPGGEVDERPIGADDMAALTNIARASLSDFTEPLSLSTERLVLRDTSGRTFATENARQLAWEVRRGSSTPAPVLTASGVRAIRFSPDDGALVHTTGLGHLAHWDLSFGDMTAFIVNASAVTARFAPAIGFSRDGTRVLTIKDQRDRVSWTVGTPPPTKLPPAPVGIDGTLDGRLELGRDVGASARPAAPSNLRIIGDVPTTTIITHASAIASSGERVFFGGFITPPEVLFVSAEEALSGRRLWTVNLPKDRGRRVTAIAAARDGSSVAVATDTAAGPGVTWLDGATGRVRADPALRDPAAD